MPTIQCLQEHIKSGNCTYPVFIGFISASEVLQIAEAPSFSKKTTNQQIAQNILTPPIKDWQRPLNVERVQNIKLLFNNSGEFMPNPVLLCQNGTTSQTNIEIRQQQTTSGGVPTMVWDVIIPIPNTGAPIPFWILDGQHRINGLAGSQQSGNPIPVVLLLEQGQHVYSGPIVAKLFAQVTTSATKLDDLHNEWLTFAFGLKDYANGPRSLQDRQAMECVALLCRDPIIQQAKVSNPFCNQIKFNAESNIDLTPGGFAYNCIELKDLVSKYYYGAAAPISFYLPSQDLAQQIGLAYLALTQVVQAPQNQSVFFGSSGPNQSGQRIMQDAYLVGVFSYLLHKGVPSSWENILRTLSFHTTNWNFQSWVRSLNGSHQTISKKLAFSVFAKVFRENHLPTAAGNLADYLRGNEATVVFEFSHLTPAGKPAKLGREPFTVTRGAILSQIIYPRKHIKKSSSSENIGNLVISDMKSPPGRVVFYPEIIRSGMKLDSDKHSNPLSLLITMEHYGGVEFTAQLEISW